MTTYRKTIFLDRDGVINEKRNDYVKSVTELSFLPDVFKAIRKINYLGYLVVIVTNQSAINRGLITIDQLKKIHSYMLNQFKNNNCKIDAIYYCPHRPDENCSCRKPKPGMLLQAITEFNIDISQSWLIGDDDTDIQSADQIGLNAIKIDKSKGLMAAVNQIEENVTSCN